MHLKKITLLIQVVAKPWNNKNEPHLIRTEAAQAYNVFARELYLKLL